MQTIQPRRAREARRAGPTALALISGDDVYEDLFTAAGALQDALTDEGFATRTGLGTAPLDGADEADVVVLYTALGRFTTGQRQALAQAVRGGCGLVALHSTTVPASPPEQWDEGDRLLAGLLGGHYLSHGPRPHESRFEVRLDPDHELTSGIASFEVTHEHYRLRTADDVRVLAWRETGDGAEPLVHVRRYGLGRVCYLQFGHDMRVWGEPAVRRLVRRAARWASRPDREGN
ncbi:ThuA domain-containing protein [Actinacidiphila acididurans]|uniref:ThuA domain-containing protein n=1 Tax=Actinacidiphila acididurans TaxID=2784346 RepID=A0ABS2U5I6_9ACTN|nr:ThuA domain-containing protein [Actinacidiphila acididurans]MBM9510277.1 ThuA domain-containing protein [Actinacidiphila acididurans]